MFRVQNFIPPISLVIGEARRLFISQLTEQERDSLQGTEWEPILQIRWRPQIEAPINLWHLEFSETNDQNLPIPWFDISIYHFRFTPFTKFNRRVLYFLHRREKLVHGSRPEPTGFGSVTNWHCPYPTHGLRETHFVISIGSYRVKTLNTQQLLSDESEQVDKEIRNRLTWSRPTRELYKQALEHLENIGYPSPPLRQLFTLEEAEQYLSNVLPIQHRYRQVRQLLQIQQAAIDLRVRLRREVRPTTYIRRDILQLHVDHIPSPSPHPANPIARTFQELGPEDESPHPFF